MDMTLHACFKEGGLPSPEGLLAQRNYGPSVGVLLPAVTKDGLDEGWSNASGVAGQLRISNSVDNRDFPFVMLVW